MPGSRRLQVKRLAESLIALCTASGLAVAEPVDAIDAPLTSQPGNPDNGRQIIENRQLSACLLCHAGPFPAPHLQGTIGPSLNGVGTRLTPGQIRLRLINSRMLNPNTTMPPYFVVKGLNRTGRQWQGKPILTEQQIEDTVAFLATLRTP